MFGVHALLLPRASWPGALVQTVSSCDRAGLTQTGAVLAHYRSLTQSPEDMLMQVRQVFSLPPVSGGTDAASVFMSYHFSGVRNMK